MAAAEVDAGFGPFISRSRSVEVYPRLKPGGRRGVDTWMSVPAEDVNPSWARCW